VTVWDSSSPRFAKLAAVLIFVGSLAVPAVSHATTRTFVGPGNDWFAAGNWSPSGVPSSSDDVVIDSGSVTVSGAAASARSLAFDTGVSQSGSLTVAGGASLTTSSSGTSAIGGFLVVDGTLTLGDPTTFAASANSNGINVSGTLEVGSTLTLDGSDAVHGNINATGVSALIHVGSGGSLVRDTSSATDTIGPPVDNDGSVSVKTGTLNLAGGDAGSTAGSFAVSSGATLLAGGTTFESPSVTGAGVLQIGSATATVGSGDTFSIATVDLTTGKLTLDKDVSLANFASSGGTRNGTGTLTITGTADLSDVTLAGGSTTTVAATVTSLALTHYLAVDGTLNLGTPTTYASSADSNGINVSGTVNIDSTLTLDGSDSVNGNINATGVGAAIDVAAGGSLVRDTSSATQTIGPAVNNGGGSVSVQTGTLAVNGGLTQTAGTTQTAAGTHLSAAVTVDGGTLAGTGDLSGPVDNSGGTVAPGDSPGVMTIDGDYTQSAAGTLRSDIAGTTVGTGYDRLAVGGTATIDGTLAIVTGAGFDPALGDAFVVLTSGGARTGQFGTLTGASVNGKTYTAHYDASDVTLAVGLAAPANTAAPTIPTAAATGTTISCDPGSWTGSPTFAFSWLSDGVPISGATGQQYTLADGDSGHRITCHIVATNAVGSAAADSNTLVPTLAPPANVGGGTTAPPTAVAPTPVPIAQLATLPSAHVCVSRRHFPIHLKGIAGIVKAQIKLTGVPARTVRGKALGLPIDLRGLPKGTVVVKITITRTSGRRLVGKRTYHTCASRRIIKKHRH